MQKRIKLRSEVTFAVREWMTGQGFYEIENPTFIKSTPEGARDYLVPADLYPGKFYALPQSPQLYKQILMVSGFDKSSIARCYRDEDARGDRQPEFTQIDIEMSFVNRDDVLTMIEGLMGHVFQKTMNVALPAKFRRIAYDDALELYGSDKPDLRFAMEMQDFAPLRGKIHLPGVQGRAAAGRAESRKAKIGVTIAGGGVKALVVPGKADYSRKQIEELEAAAKIYKAKGMAWMKVAAGADGKGALEGGASKFFNPAPDGSGAPADLRWQHHLRPRRQGRGPHPPGGGRQAPHRQRGPRPVRSKLGKDLGHLQPERFRVRLDRRLPHVRYNEEEQKWDTAHHNVHLAPGEVPRHHGDRSGLREGRPLRPRAQRLRRARLRLHPHPRPGTAEPCFPHRRLRSRGGGKNASASSPPRSSTAPRPTAASRRDSTAW
jgi:aspartyl-tRNA synthetase